MTKTNKKWYVITRTNKDGVKYYLNLEWCRCYVYSMNNILEASCWFETEKEMKLKFKYLYKTGVLNWTDEDVSNDSFNYEEITDDKIIYQISGQKEIDAENEIMEQYYNQMESVGNDSIV